MIAQPIGSAIAEELLLGVWGHELSVKYDKNLSSRDLQLHASTLRSLFELRV